MSMQHIIAHDACRDDAPFSKLKVIVAGSLKALLARQQKQKEEEEKTKTTASSSQEGTVCGYSNFHSSVIIFANYIS